MYREGGGGWTEIQFVIYVFLSIYMQFFVFVMDFKMNPIIEYCDLCHKMGLSAP